MEKLELRLESLAQAIKTLEKSLEVIQKPQHDELYIFLRDSVIQRFEYSIDGFWKFLKLYIQENQHIVIEFANPRETLRIASTLNILTPEDMDILLKGVRHRNLTSHIYNEKRAEEIYSAIPQYHKVMKKIVKNIQL